MTEFQGHTFAKCTARDESTEWIVVFIFIQLAIGLFLIMYSACASFSVDQGNEGSRHKYDKDGNGFLCRKELLVLEADLKKKGDVGIKLESARVEESEGTGWHLEAASALNNSDEKYAQPKMEYKELKAAWKLRTAGIFVLHIRRESNFIRNNTNPSLVRPPDGSVENCPMVFSRYALLRCLLKQPMMAKAFIYCAGLAFISGAVGTAYWLDMYRGVIGEKSESKTVLISMISVGATDFIAQNKLLPTFLLFGLVGQAVMKFKDFLVNMHSLQGRIHDIALQVGGSIKTPNRPETRKLCYKLYRYLNTVHSLCYASTNPCLPQQLSQYEDLGLLTAAEIKLLAPMKNKARDSLLPWIGIVINELKRTGGMDWWSVDEKAVTALRDICAKHHHLFRRNYPNVWLGFMRFTIDILLLNEVFLYPAASLIYSDESLCQGGYDLVFLSWQWCTMISVFFMAMLFHVTFVVVQCVSNPFIDSVDFLSSDAVMCSTEQCIFGSIRGSFTEDPDSDINNPSAMNGSPSDITSIANDPDQYQGISAAIIHSVVE